MSDNKEVSAHETARSLNSIMETLREGVTNQTFKALLGTTPTNEPIFVFEWPNCPMYGTATVYFGPKDLENYKHRTHPWEHMKSAVDGNFTSTHEDVLLTDEQHDAAMAALGQGKIICPLTGNTSVRLYDHVFSVSAKSDASMKLLFCSAIARWSLTVTMSSGGGLKITDVQRKIESKSTSKK